MSKRQHDVQALVEAAKALIKKCGNIPFDYNYIFDAEIETLIDTIIIVDASTKGLPEVEDGGDSLKEKLTELMNKNNYCFSGESSDSLHRKTIVFEVVSAILAHMEGTYSPLNDLCKTKEVEE